MRYPDPFGHEYMYTNAVYDAAIDAGISTVIYGSGNIKNDNFDRKVNPLFKDLKLNVRKSKYSFLKLLGIIHENFYLFKKLKSISLNEHCPEEVFLFHTPFYRHFPAIYFWYRNLEKKPILILILRYSLFSSEKYLKYLKKNFYLNLIKIIYIKLFYYNFGNDKIILGTDSDILVQEFYKFEKIPVVLFPIPIPNQIFQIGTISQSMNQQFLEKEKYITIVSLGPARDDKGSYLLYETIVEVLNRWDGKKIQFLIQTKTSDQGSERTRRTIGLLSSIGPCVKTFNRSLSQEEYWNIFNQADIVLLPYEAKAYRARTSGIFAEAMTLGKYIIIPRDTWMEMESNKFGNDSISIFDGESSRSLIEAILESLAIVSNPIRTSSPNQNWKGNHNANFFIKTLMLNIKKIS